MADKNIMVSCPNCGGELKKNSKACPHCGSDERTGWSDSTYLDNIDLGDDVDYEDLVNKEFPKHSAARPKITWITIAGAIVLFFFIAAMLKILW
ncbi:MAG: zinc ribbon domain-containing protein [Chitinivibrionales bacterium]